MDFLFYNSARPVSSYQITSTRAPLEFHRRLPAYKPTPLVEAPKLAAQLGLRQVLIKDESHRMGLPAFKILGASWAIYRALEQHAGGSLPAWGTIDDLRDRLSPLRPLMLVAATDGNHGRAVARVARWLGFQAHIFVPAGTARARIDALMDEGAAVTIVDGTYDDAVARSAALAGPRCLIISDTSWPGYEDVPRWVIEGYTTIFWEIEDALAQRGEPAPDSVVVQMGVGALAAAVVAHYRTNGAPGPTASDRPGAAAPPVSGRQPSIIGVEPTRAACVLASMRAGTIVAVPGPHDSIMAGLNCGMPSLIAWPLVSTGIDLFMAIEDERARQAMRVLADMGLAAGETGAAGVGGLLDLLTGAHADTARAALGIDETSCVLALVTEGVTDPAAYMQIVGAPAA